MMRAEQLRRARFVLHWTIGVTLTHTLFPMTGYLLTYFSIQLSPAITPIVGLIAFGCIAKFLYEELGAYVQEDTEKSENTQLMVTLGLILAVSWDALWSGPAKSAQVIGWPELFVWMSFLVVGVIVALCALAGLKLAKRLSNMVYSKKVLFSQYIGMWIQYSVIGYFGLLALMRYTLDIEIHWWQVLSLCALSMLVVMETLQVRRKLNTQLA